MARPRKRGLGYFPLDTDFFSNRKIQRLLRQYGCEGVTVYLALLCDLYESNGYYMPVTDDLFFDMAFVLHIEEKRVKEIIGYCVKVRLFDSKMLAANKIYTSIGIQTRYREVCKRTINQMNPAFMLCAQPEVYVTKTPVNVTENPVFVAETSINVTKTPTKGKGKGKGKGNEIKVNKVNKKTNEIKRQTTGTDEESVRRAELLRMAEAATKGS